MQAPDTKELIPHNSREIHKIMEGAGLVATFEVGKMVEVSGGMFIIKRVSKSQLVLLPATEKNKRIYGHE